MRHSILLSIVLCSSFAATQLQAQAPSGAGRTPTLTIAPDGSLLKDNQPYRGVGANYFDLFLRVLQDPSNTSSLDGLQKLSEAGIPFVRFAVAYDNRQWRVFFDQQDEFLRRLDLVVRRAEEANIGLIPSFFWSFTSFPDLVDEPRDQWGNPSSQTSVKMREVVSTIVQRYKDSPAIWGWEFGNEPNLQADLPNAEQFRKKGGTQRDDLTSPVMVTMLTEFAKEVRHYDSQRPIFAGHSHPRPAAWHNTAERSWTADTREQTLEVIRRDNPQPLNTISIHIYGAQSVEKEIASWASSHAEYLRIVCDLARAMKRPVFVGEFGLDSSDTPEQTRIRFEQILSAMESSKVDLAAFWIFDFKSQDNTWNVTFDNPRAYMLQLIAEANRRWNEAARASNH